MSHESANAWNPLGNAMWKGLVEDGQVRIYEISPWPVVKNLTKYRLVAKELSRRDADRILKAVGGEWA